MDLNSFVQESFDEYKTKNTSSLWTHFEECVSVSSLKGPKSVHLIFPELLEILFGTRKKTGMIEKSFTEKEKDLVLKALGPSSCFIEMLFRFSTNKFFFFEVETPSENVVFKERKIIRQDGLNRMKLSIIEYFLYYIVNHSRNTSVKDRTIQRKEKNDPLSQYWTVLFNFFFPTNNFPETIFSSEIFRSLEYPYNTLSYSVSISEFFCSTIMSFWFSYTEEVSPLHVSFILHIKNLFKKNYNEQHNKKTAYLTICRVLDPLVSKKLFWFLLSNMQKNYYSEEKMHLLIDIFLSFLFPFENKKEYPHFVFSHFFLYYSLFYVFIEKQASFLNEIVGLDISESIRFKLEKFLEKTKSVLDSFIQIKDLLKEGENVLKRSFETRRSVLEEDNYNNREERNILLLINKAFEEMEQEAFGFNKDIVFDFFLKRRLEKTFCFLLYVEKKKLSSIESSDKGNILKLTNSCLKTALYLFSLNEECLEDYKIEATDKNITKTEPNILKHIWKGEKTVKKNKTNIPIAKSYENPFLLWLSLKIDKYSEDIKKHFILFFEKQTGLHIPEFLRRIKLKTRFLASYLNILFISVLIFFFYIFQ